MKRKRILEKKKEVEQIIRAVSSREKDHLDSFPHLRQYSANGLSIYLTSGRGNKLSSQTKHYICNLLKANMEGPYGSEWSIEEKNKHREMVSQEAHYMFVCDIATDNTNKEISCSETEFGPTCVNGRGPIVGFLHYRFIVEEGVPVLYVYELQLEPRVQKKGLGVFLMQLIELIATKNQMGAVMLTVQKTNSSAMRFYTSKLGYTISTISPSKVDPQLGLVKSYEILCKTFDSEAKAILQALLTFHLLMVFPCRRIAQHPTIHDPPPLQSIKGGG
ncbi:N-alpha-acetyltransferase 40 isoform X2 [Impatiens glandulifera]|uniref:N-alpha-acetyltransferase 40 isoform X2 n=1 Tax=Impatiens glandulifera TaxID=253017 RepID=UPI001FB18984|nr:N-alpha-acetyltransferase 40 isoform X2 [Impatiens glandulifera]